MFTGIIEEVGMVRSVERHDGYARLHIDAPGVVEDAEIGDSIAVDGCCLTITSLPDGGFTADLMLETLRATALGDLDEGSAVNLEAAMRVTTRFGGHLVQGHVDGVGEVVRRDEQPGTVFLDISAPDGLARYLVPKGSVTVDGVSLTIVEIDGAGVFRVGLIPHTLGATTFRSAHPGQRVNLEVDVVAKYVERLLESGVTTPYNTDGPTSVPDASPSAATDLSATDTSASDASPSSATDLSAADPSATDGFAPALSPSDFRAASDPSPTGPAATRVPSASASIREESR